MSLISFKFSALGLAFPALIETCVFWNQTKGWKKIWMVSKNIVIAFIGICGLVAGSCTSINEIIHTFFV